MENNTITLNKKNVRNNFIFLNSLPYTPETNKSLALLIYVTFAAPTLKHRFSKNLTIYAACTILFIFNNNLLTHCNIYVINRLFFIYTVYLEHIYFA